MPSDRAERLRDYFDLQLRFALALAERAGLDPADALLRYTNLHRRLAFGRPVDGEPHPGWRCLAIDIAQAPDQGARLEIVLHAYARAGAEPPPPNQLDFGAFGCNPPDADGVVRIHFSPRDDDGVSPLAPAKTARRRAELRALASHVQRSWRNARTIRGTSWLYHLDAYRRLFPPGYVATRVLAGPSLRYSGNANWGQFLTYRGEAKGAAIARMRANLPDLDPARPWLVFPLPALTPEAPVAVFYDDFELTG